MNKSKWIARAEELGLEGLEITESRRSSKELTWFEGKTDSFVTSRVLSTSMRALADGKIVSISMEKTDDDEMDAVLSRLKETVQSISESEKDELVGQMETDEVASLKVWNEPSVDQVKELLSSLEKKLQNADPRVTQVNYLGWEQSAFESELTNSLGVEVSDAGRYQMVGAGLTMSENGEVRDDYLTEVVYDPASFDQDAFVKKLTDAVAAQLNAKSMASRTTKVILDHDTMSTLFSCFAGMFSGSMIAKGISPISNDLGKQIFSEKITVIDNPRSQDALLLQNYDDEGHPTYEKVVVDKGVFETVLHNTRSALKMQAQSTGNGFKSGGGATDAMPMNMYIVPGQTSARQLEQEMENGVVITDLAGMHAGIDFVTTNFSLQAKGFLVENGKRVRPLTLITVAGNFLELMKKVQSVGDDLEWKARTIACPSILFEEAAIGGNE